MTQISTRHEKVARDFSAVADRVTKWDAPTPVPEWVAGDIVEHLLTWFPSLLQSWGGPELKDIPSRGLAERWRLRTVEVQAILDDRELAERTIESGGFAGMRLDEAIDRMYTADIFMHTWDLAKAADIEIHPSASYAAQVHEGMAAMEENLRASGHFGPAVETDSDDAVEKLMAFVGRDPQWSAPNLASATS
ncbi:TIGR03086 family protein [Corynebacterium sp. NPDC060344]|uniref:TIGR03086 family protein n=1 Tax=Corynebacterium sp. NPDC060344 TaxID=3347101 RepID=UPI00364F4495